MPFIHRLRVRYAETDCMGIAHHASYVPWLEEARIEALRELGHSYRDCEEAGYLLAVIEVAVRYRRSLRFDDELTLSTTVRACSRSRLEFTTRIACADALAAEGRVSVACIDRDGRPQRLPPAIDAAVRAVAEAG